MKKVLFVTHPLGLPVDCSMGGAVEALLKALIEENEKNKVFKFYFASAFDVKKKYNYTEVKKFDIKRTKFFGHQFKNLLMKYYYRPIFEYAKEIQPDYIIYENEDRFFHIDLFANEFGKEKIFLHVHWCHPQKSDITKSIGNFIACSDFIAKDWQDANKNTEKMNYFTLKNCLCIDNSSKTLTENEKKELRKSLNLKEDDYVVLYCGRLQKEKGIETLIQGFNLINNDKIKLLVVGGSRNLDSKITPFVRHLYFISKKKTKQGCIKFLGYKTNGELYKYYEIADCQVLPSICQEAAPLVAIESRAHGLPQIITKSGGLPEYAQPDATILPIDKDLPQNIAKAIEDFYVSKPKRQYTSIDQYTKEKYFENFKNLLLK